MSELQVGLLAIGAAIVAAVLGYNKWQESRYRREVEASLSPPADDVLLRKSSARVEPTLEPVAAAPRAMSAGPAAPAVLSEAIDCIVVLEPSGTIAGRTVIEAAVAALAGAAKAVNMDGEVAGHWEPLRREGTYSRVRIGMQLVDRRGAVGLEDLRAFEAGVAGLASSLGARASAADLEDALRTAAALDRLCGEVDIQIAVHLVKAGEPLSGATIAAMAEAHGLTLDPDGRFRQRDGDGRELYSLVNEEAAPFHPGSVATLRTSAVLAELDVPRAPGGPAAFIPFRDFCLQAAATLGATLVDDNRNRLAPASFDAISAQLGPVYQSMQAHGMAAGSPVALRLFS